ncbi:MAG: UDP-N-acetylmuramate--L-alanine ligase [Vicinamibacterales bacterium]
MVLGRTRRVHFVGIGGIGMSGIAELLVNLGYEVSGSDQSASPALERLAAMGVVTAVGHAPAHVGPADVVVFSSAIRPDNPEIAEARARGIPVVPRAEMLAELMRLRVGIAVAGAHGKTSTTSMVALVLERAGLDPTAVIGGRLRAFGSNARLGHGRHMVVEADESDRSFLKLSPTVAVITNIDREHMEAYGGFEDLQQAFVDFANKVPFYGAVVACADDAEVTRILPRLTRRATTYGIDAADAQVAATDVALEGFGSTCTVVHRSAHDRRAAPAILGRLRLQVPGRHSVLNALAAVAVGLELAVPFDVMAGALEEFTGAERRFEVRGVVHGVTVVDDYGHHPTEIAAVLAAARAAAPRRVVVAFQPHRYSRTAQLLPDFAAALAPADEVVLTDIYAASEPPIPGVTVEALAEAVNRRRTQPARVVKALDQVPAAIAELARPGDLVITLGAGSIGQIPGAVVRALDMRLAQGGPS